MPSTDADIEIKNAKTLTLHVKVAWQLTIRLWIAYQLIKAAAWVAGMGLEIDEVE